MSPLSNRSTVPALLIAAVALFAARPTAAAELKIESGGFAYGKAELPNVSRYGDYEFSRGFNSGTIKATSRGYSMAEASATLRYNGPASAQKIEFETWANPSSSQRDAISSFFTCPNPKRPQYGNLKVTVKPTGADRIGTLKTVTIVINWSSSITGKANGTNNRVHVALEDSVKLDRIATNSSATHSQTFTGRIKCGGSFTIKFLTTSAALKNTTAKQTLTMELRVN